MIHQAPNMVSPASQDAMNAVRAAKQLYKWGPYATNRFVENRDIKRMFLIASINELDMGIKRTLNQ